MARENLGNFFEYFVATLLDSSTLINAKINHGNGKKYAKTNES